MRISVELDRERGVAVAACEGALRRDDAERGATAAWEAAGDRARSVVWDFREATFELSASDVRAMAKFVRRYQPTPPPARVAFVTPRAADYGLARMFEVFREDPRTAFRVFRSFDEAVQWASPAAGEEDA